MISNIVICFFSCSRASYQGLLHHQFSYSKTTPRQPLTQSKKGKVSGVLDLVWQLFFKTVMKKKI